MKRVLIVEDEAGIQEVLEELLRTECGFTEIVKAMDGLEGFLAVMTSPFDLITLDQKMPYLVGTDLLLALRNKPGPNQNTPVLFISAYIPLIPEELKQAENTYFLDKPVEFPRLIRYVKMAVKK